MASASSQSTVRAVPSATAPATQNTPAAMNQTRMRPARSRSSVPGPAAAKVRNVWRPSWIARYAPMNSPALSPKASGIAAAIIRLASMIAIISSRTTGDSGSSSFVTQVV